MKEALKNRELKDRFLYSFMIMVIVRVLTQIPMPGVNTSFLAEKFSGNDALGFLGIMTGGSFERFSVMALSITPYITSSIIMQLMTIVFPSLEEMQKEGETGRKKFQKITQYVTVGLSLAEAGAMTFAYGKNMLVDTGALNVLVIISSLTAGSMILVWLGGQATEKGLGNGISLILMVNIASSLPSQLASLWSILASGSNIGVKILYVFIAAVVITGMVAFAVYLQEGERKIPVQHSQKISGNKMTGARTGDLPIRISAAGVIPVIFASSLMSMPSLVTTLAGKTPGGIPGRLLTFCSQARWFDPADPVPTLGFALYGALVIFFAYYYTAVTFSPLEVAENLKKSGGVIPGIRPGTPTRRYLESILRYTVFFGAAGLLFLCAVPMAVSGALNVSLSFGGTSLVIIVAVISEMRAQAKSILAAKKVKTFL